jgi:uncharacterized phage-associated protein
MSKSKSLAAAQYILDKQRAKGDTLSPMQLIKLVYIAQGFMLGKKGKPLLDESVEAWQYGPVVPSVYHAVKHFRSDPVVNVAGNIALLSTDEKEILDLVADSYAQYDGVTLSSATHKNGTPWHVTWSSSGKSNPISNDLIEHFYIDLLNKPSHSAL